MAVDGGVQLAHRLARMSESEASTACEWGRAMLLLGIVLQLEFCRAALVIVRHASNVVTKLLEIDAAIAIEIHAIG